MAGVLLQKTQPFCTAEVLGIMDWKKYPWLSVWWASVVGAWKTMMRAVKMMEAKFVTSCKAVKIQLEPFVQESMTSVIWGIIIFTSPTSWKWNFWFTETIDSGYLGMKIQLWLTKDQHHWVDISRYCSTQSGSTYTAVFRGGQGCVSHKTTLSLLTK